MGILDDIKPLPKKPKPRSLTLDGPNLAVDWDDGSRSNLLLKFLRERCPCAGCVDEWSGQRTLDPKSVPANVYPLSMTPVGNYAVQIGWSDDHRSGIYSWELLRRLTEEAAAAKAGA